MLFENRSAGQIRRRREDPGTPHARLSEILNDLSMFHFSPGASEWRTLSSRTRSWDEYGTTVLEVQMKTVINDSLGYAPSGRVVFVDPHSGNALGTMASNPPSPAGAKRSSIPHVKFHFGRERRQTAEVRARRVIAETLRKARLTSEGFKLLSANHRIKVDLAQRLRRETTMELKWIAQELGVGSWEYLSNLLNQEPRTTSQSAFNL